MSRKSKVESQKSKVKSQKSKVWRPYIFNRRGRYRKRKIEDRCWYSVVGFLPITLSLAF